MIAVKGLTRRYDDFVAVDDVSFSISQGEIVGLLGHNGAGKTTVMKMLTGYLEPSNGDICIGGHRISEQPQEAQALIGYLPENLPVYPEMIVVDYLDYCANLRGIAPSHQKSAVRDAIEKTEISGKALAPISTLSRGYKQRVGVAQALLHQPKLLILDEPTNGLDPHQTQQMRQLIRDLSGEATVILSTHIMQEVDALCDRVLILDSGSLAADSTLDELSKSNVLQVDTSARTSQLDAALKAVGISSPYKTIAMDEEVNRYHITVTEGGKVNQLCAEIAEQLMKQDAKLFSLNPMKRDLETVFRTIHEERNTEQEVRHAA